MKRWSVDTNKWNGWNGCLKMWGVMTIYVLALCLLDIAVYYITPDILLRFPGVKGINP